MVIGATLLALLSRKWCLPAASLVYLVGTGVLAGVVAAPPLSEATLHPLVLFAAPIALQFAFYLALLAWRFYRDPERTPPADRKLIVSPADGTVIYIRKIRPGGLLVCEKQGAKMQLDELQGSRLTTEELWQIGISMVFTDVHVNRAPVDAIVKLAIHRPGKFLSLRNEKALNVNERQTLLLDTGVFQVALVQIASRLVRQIVAYVRQGDTVERGQRIGMIKFGSQVDVFLPIGVAPTLKIEVGSVLVAGESTLATFAGVLTDSVERVM